MAMTLADVRAQYPQYKDVPDQQLADALYTKYYPTVDRREFDARIGLKPYDDLGTSIVKGAENAIPELEQSLAGLSQMAGETLTGMANKEIHPSISFNPITDMLNAPGNAVSLAVNSLPQDVRNTLATEGAKQSLRGQLDAIQATKSIQPVDAPLLSPAGIANVAITSTIQMVPALAASILLKNPTPALVTAFGQSAGQAYQQGRAGSIDWQKGFLEDASNAGLSPEQARQYAGLYGVAEAIPEALPLGVLLKEGGSLIARVAKGVVTEGVSEGITQAAQTALDKGYVQPDMTWGQAWPQIVQAMAAGAISGGALGTMAHGEHAAIDQHAPPAPEPQQPDVVSLDTPIEQQLGLPSPGKPLALPSPEQFAPTPEQSARRQPPAPQTGIEAGLPTPTDAEAEYQARVALQKTRQAETAALLQTAREAVTPLGTFSKDEIGGPAAQRVNQLRIQTGRPLEAPVTIDELARAKVPQSQIDTLIQTRRPLSTGEALTPLDIHTAAQARNIVSTDGNFGELARRTTGQANVEKMTQTQLGALKSTIDSLPAHPAPVTVPIAAQSPFTDEMYGKAVDALRKQGRYTAGAIKDATGFKTNEDIAAVRDAMVRRGQLVQRGKGDYRLFDVTGAERQPTPADLPAGAFTEHVVRRIPVSQIQIRQDGKSLGNFNSASEARGKISALRAAELAKGGTRSQIELAPAADVAYGVMQNRYDEQGNLLGQVPVDTYRNEGDAQAAAHQLNHPDTGARYTSTQVTPNLTPAPLRQVNQTTLGQHAPEVIKRLNKLASDRKLAMLGVRVAVKPKIATPEGDSIEGQYFNKLMQLTTEHLSPDMSVDQMTEKLAQILDHETVHALRAAGVLAPETDAWKTLIRYARRAQRGQTGETYTEWANRAYAGVPGYERTDSREEEAIAEAFRAWASNKRSVAGAPANAFRQIVEWFRRLLSSVPERLFNDIATGKAVTDILTPPGSQEPRAKATDAMQEAQAGLAQATEAKDDNAQRVLSREFLRAQAQAREDRYGRAGPKTVLGTNPTRAYSSADIADRTAVAKIVDKFKSENGVTRNRLMTLLPEDLGYLSRIADAQAKGIHNPGDPAVAKAYSALIDETRAMYKALGTLTVDPHTTKGAPYASAQTMMDDIASGHLTMRLSSEMFGEGADNPKHPMYEPSGYKATDGSVLTNNDLLRVVHDVYGHGQSGFRDDPRGQYNAYHEHARLLSPLAARALATETLAQNSWQNYGPHLRRRDGTVPRETDIDYLPPNKKEFAQQKAFVLPEDLIAADPGWTIAEKADGAVEAPENGPKFSKFDKFEEDLPGGRLYGNANRSPGGQLSKPGTPSPTFTNTRPGTQFFGGEMAEHQAQMVRDGQRGATMIYMHPADFMALAPAPENPEQAAYNDAVAAGYKLSTLPSLVLDGYAGNVRAVNADGHAGIRALPPDSGQIPVVLYPKKGQDLGHVTALEGPDGARVPWPAEGRQEYFPSQRPDGEPTYSLNGPFGNRLPDGPMSRLTEPRFSIFDDEEGDTGGPRTYNIVQQRIDGAVGRFIHNIGRAKRDIPVFSDILQHIPFSGGARTIFDARVRLQDKMLTVKELMEKAAENHAVVNDLNDTYMLEQLYHGKVFHAIRDREDRFHIPLLQSIKEAHDGPLKIQPKEVEDYVYAMHALERNPFLRARGSVGNSPSGMTDAEANKILNKAALDGKQPTLQSIHKLWMDVIKNTNDTYVEYGLLDPKVAATPNFNYYTPLRGIAEEDIEPDDVGGLQRNSRVGKGYSVSGPENKHMVGRRDRGDRGPRKAGDLLANLLLQNTDAVIRGEKNEVVMSFARFIHDNPEFSAGYGSILAKVPTKTVVGPDGRIRQAVDPNYKGRPDIVIGKWKGQQVVMQVEPRIARALNSDYVTSNNDIVNTLTNIAGWMSRYQSTIATSMSPTFMVKNFMRDSGTVLAFAQQYGIKNFGPSILRDVGSSMNGIREVVFGHGEPTGEWGKAFVEMQKAGGTVEFMDIRTLEKHVDDIRKNVTRIGLNMTARQSLNFIKGVGHVIENTNTVVENSLRLSAYVNARRAGVSSPQAAYLAKNITVNFNKGGELKPFLNAWYMFYNAGAQSIGMVGSVLKNKYVRRTIGAVVVAGIVGDMLNRLLSTDQDKNGVTDYDDIPQYDLEHNLIIMNPFIAGGKDKYIKIALPLELNAFYNFGRNLSAGLFGYPEAKSPLERMGKAMGSTAMTFLDSNNPLGGAQSILNFIAPTPADPIVDLATNKDFAGNDIVPKRFDVNGVPVPESQKYWSNTGAVPKDVAAWINSMTGGDEVRKGAFDISPETLKYGYDYVTGGVGKFLAQTFGLGADVATQNFDNLDVGQVPFARDIVGTVGQRGNANRYYAIDQEINTVAQEIKVFEDNGNRAALMKTVSEHPTEVKLIDAFKAGSRDLSSLGKELRALRDNSAMPASKKREAEKAIKTQQDRIMAQLNRLYFTTKNAVLH